MKIRITSRSLPIKTKFQKSSCGCFIVLNIPLFGDITINHIAVATTNELIKTAERRLYTTNDKAFLFPRTIQGINEIKGAVPTDKAKTRC
ncbi:MAG: hypothetical protein HRT58_13470 [Crocinitomicaceae bacterium]|nr:hypothetical protein [Flavobacteriales bacterium]NQZ36673.1 hypothetical protein [Crocinitomicaceae bacterium]